MENLSSTQMTTTGIVDSAIVEPENDLQQVSKEPFQYEYTVTGRAKDAKCLICNVLYPQNNIGWHMQNRHNQGQKLGENFVLILPDGTIRDKKKATYAERKPKKTAREKEEIQVISPKGGVLRIPVMLEIPYVFGKPEVR